MNWLSEINYNSFIQYFNQVSFNLKIKEFLSDFNWFMNYLLDLFFMNS